MDAFFAKIQKSNAAQLKEEQKQTKLLQDILKGQQAEAKKADQQRRRDAQAAKTAAADKNKLAAMGMEEGMRQAMSQADAILAEG